MSLSGALSVVQYYANLLILQYLGKPKAYATAKLMVTPSIMPQNVSEQTLVINGVPTAGGFDISWNGSAAVTINWNDSTATIQTKLRTIAALAAVTVTGSIAAQAVVVSMIGIPSPAINMVAANQTMVNSFAQNLTVSVQDSDDTLPLAVQNGFNLTGPKPAVGKQLDILGKYCGVSRTGPGFYGQITLGDADFLSLIKMAIIKNNSGSSLATIQQYLNQFFPGQIFVFDYANMQMSYLITPSVGSQDLVQLFVTEGLLPKPMAVQLASVIYTPVLTNFFGYRTYDLPGYNVKPYNSYDSYDHSWRWLSYDNAINLV